ncbi:LamG-like jellyroll fold domain-containing protein [Tenggerimyces flavus]|uniref:LamG-like jellyroll fold domain-containing protein n=1 Tax=Tenggerimyces flavus TaxID=1708749 RepID=A0ABV7Y521_9ACTN|nr:LamG-like jellyroll fold domain-containing protein [Tenggerimyces flavus]
MNLNEGGALQWATYATNRDAISTNWGHELPRETWWHAAVVNDGRHTILYVDGSELLRNPSTPAPGLRTTSEFWMLGAYHYDRVIERSFYGWLGDVRIVNRTLPVRSFML